MLVGDDAGHEPGANRMETSQFLTIEQIVAKKGRGEQLTPYESSSYRLNFRDDGTRYSADPKLRQLQYAEDNARTEQARRKRAGVAR